MILNYPRSTHRNRLSVHFGGSHQKLYATRNQPATVATGHCMACCTYVIQLLIDDALRYNGT